MENTQNKSGIDKIEEKDSYFIYTPNNTSGNKDVVIYYPGAGGYKNDDVAFREYIGNNPDKIVIINKSPGQNIETFKEELKNLETNKHFNINNIDIYGHSLGNKSQFITAEALNKSGYHTSHVVVLDTADLLNCSKINDEMANNFSKNGTSVLILNQYNRNTVTTYTNMLIKAGVPVSHVYCGNNGIDMDYNLHSKINRQFVQNGLIDLLSGEGNLNVNNIDLNCQYSTYDYSTNSWKDNISANEFNKLFNKSIRPVSQFTTLDKNFNHLKSLEMLNGSGIATSLGYASTISSDSEYVISQMNTIRSSISKTGFIGNLGNKLGTIAGGNDVLAMEGDIIAKYFEISGNLLEKLVSETESIASISLTFDELDKELAKYAKDLGKDTSSLTTQELVNFSQTTNKYNISKLLASRLSGGYKMDLSKYTEKPSAGFELWLSNRIYTIKDFDTAYAKQWGYSKEQALEAFIGVCIAESDKTPDGLLSTVSVALNRCESKNWATYYTNGTQPFDQMFAKNGTQYSQIRNTSNGNRVYENYMPSVVGEDTIDAYLEKGYNTNYAELRGIVMDALDGGLRNNDYTGFRAYIPDKYSGNYLNPNSGFYKYENYNVDSAAAEAAKNQRISISLAGTSYRGKDTIKVTPLDKTDSTETISATISSTYNENSNAANTIVTDNNTSNTTYVNTSNYTNKRNTAYLPKTTNYSNNAAQTNTNTHPTIKASTDTKTTNNTDITIISETNTAKTDNTSNTANIQVSTKESTKIDNTTDIDTQQIVNNTIKVDTTPSMIDDNADIDIAQKTETNQTLGINTGIDVSPYITTSENNKNDIEITPSYETTQTDETQELTQVQNDYSSNKNSIFKTIGSTIIGAAAIGGMAYGANRKIKDIKANQSIEDDDDENDKNKDSEVEE